MLDFTLKTLTKLYDAFIFGGYKIMPLGDFSKNNKPEKSCILRHDVDRDLGNALKLAETERKMNISASYYFRYPQTFNVKIIDKIYRLGHEIGYHYEVLAATNGDVTAAMDLFKKNLEEFRKNFPVKTICAHGSPFSKWDNKKIWETNKIADFELVAEASLSLDFNEILYLTDTGRNWNINKGNIRDKVNTKLNFKARNTYEVIAALSGHELPDKIMLNIHPNRWNDDFLKWSVELVAQNIKNVGKKILALR